VQETVQAGMQNIVKQGRTTAAMQAELATLAGLNRTDLWDTARDLGMTIPPMASEQTVRRWVENRVRTQYVMDGLNAVLEGGATIQQFGQAFGYTPDGTMERELLDFMRNRGKLSNLLADQVFKNGGSIGLVSAIRSASDSYVTLIYERFILGQAFTPTKAARAAAVRQVGVNIGRDVLATAKRAQRLARAVGPDVLDFIQHGDLNKVRHLQIPQLEAARKVREHYQRFANIMGRLAYDPVAKTVRFQSNANAIAEEAEKRVRHYLSEYNEGAGQAASTAGGPLDVEHMRKRILDPVFKALYEAVQNPADRIAMTIAVQEQAFAGQAMIGAIVEEGRDIWWSEFSDPERGLTVKLPDRASFGKLAGAYVTRGIQEQLNPPIITPILPWNE
jgi:hypothetical protein